MSSLKYIRGATVSTPRPIHEALRRLAAVALRYASRALVRLSRRLERTSPDAPRLAPRIEFYAEAGAPEGALYLDGELVGWVSGVQRL